MKFPAYILLIVIALFSCNKKKSTIPLTSANPTNSLSTNTAIDTAAIYAQAIADVIIQARKNKITFDTLFIGKRELGQPDDFLVNQLPQTIEQTEIRLITPEEGIIRQMQSKTSSYVNQIGWVDQQKAEFVFVIFANGFAHQEVYNSYYKYNSENRKFELEKISNKITSN